MLLIKILHMWQVKLLKNNNTQAHLVSQNSGKIFGLNWWNIFKENTKKMK